MQNENKKSHSDEIIENIAHQWRQPLSQINATVSLIDKLLYKKNIQDPEIEEKLQEIERLTKYMSNTIEDFKNNLHKTQKKVKLKEIIYNAIQVLNTSFEDVKIVLKSDIEYEYEIENPSNELQQIIIVLLNNAKDALLERNIFNGFVKIDLSLKKSSYCIDIYDNAGGITKSVMDKLFEPYYTTKHTSEGSGIGLYMAKKIIQEKYNGTLEVQNVGEGSCFSILLSKGEE
ncbi:MAG: HAMP domain-containing sensor histidine kinase [Sulfurimonas sp.]|nr:HAMP domain-containing sensor histidine kinase [Sulfurimonas sp.]